jgi:hypothetical protein
VARVWRQAFWSIALFASFSYFLFWLGSFPFSRFLSFSPGFFRSSDFFAFRRAFPFSRRVLRSRLRAAIDMIPPSEMDEYNDKY